MSPFGCTCFSPCVKGCGMCFVLPIDSIQVIFPLVLLLGTSIPVLGILVREGPREVPAPESLLEDTEASHLDYLRYRNGTVENFGSCVSACQRCFQEHIQPCLGYCKKGCQEYCEEKLSHEECKDENPDACWCFCFLFFLVCVFVFLFLLSFM